MEAAGVVHQWRPGITFTKISSPSSSQSWFKFSLRHCARSNLLHRSAYRECNSYVFEEKIIEGKGNLTCRQILVSLMPFSDYLVNKWVKFGYFHIKPCGLIICTYGQSVHCCSGRHLSNFLTCYSTAMTTSASSKRASLTTLCIHLPSNITVKFPL